MPPILLIIAVGAVVASVYASTQKHKRKRKVDAAHALAARYGFEVDTERKPPPEQDFDLFDVGDNREVCFHFWRSGGDVSVFSYRYQTGGGKSRTTHLHTCALVEIPFVAPHTKIGPEGFWSGIGQKLGIRDIEVEAPRFNERYRVHSDDERFAVTLLDGRAIDWFMRNEVDRALRIELWGSWLLCATDEIELDRYFGFHDWAAEIPSHLPDVLTSLYPIRRR